MPTRRRTWAELPLERITATNLHPVAHTGGTTLRARLLAPIGRSRPKQRASRHFYTEQDQSTDRYTRPNFRQTLRLRMRKNKSPYQVMMEELAADKSLWDRDTHIKGCFADTSMSRNLERQSTLLLRCSGESLSREAPRERGSHRRSRRLRCHP